MKSEMSIKVSASEERMQKLLAPESLAGSSIESVV